MRKRASTGRFRRWALALAACTWLTLPHAAAAESSAAGGEVREADAVLVGSSSFNQSFGRIIEHELGRRGYQVARKAVSGAGLARPDFRDMNQVLEELPIGRETTAVFVYIGVNDAQAIWLHPDERAVTGAATIAFGSAEWDAVYARRVHAFLDRICRRGARRALVLLPVDVQAADMQRRLDRVRELQTQAASRTSCAVVIPTAGDQGQFDSGGTPKRLPDGYHMSPRGARIVWERIEPRVAQLLGDADIQPEAVAQAGAAR